MNLTAEVKEGQTTYVVGELPTRSAVENPGQYTCVFGMSQVVYPERHTISPVTDLFYRGESGPCTPGDPGCSFIRGYITEGTNDPGKGMIRIRENRVRPSDHTSADNMQEWLQGKQAEEASGELWKHFRTSDKVTENRNPWKQCVLDGGCGVAGN